MVPLDDREYTLIQKELGTLRDKYHEIANKLSSNQYLIAKVEEFDKLFERIDRRLERHDDHMRDLSDDCIERMNKFTEKYDETMESRSNQIREIEKKLWMMSGGFGVAITVVELFLHLVLK